MYAVVVTGGKQYRIEEGQTLNQSNGRLSKITCEVRCLDY
jgi:ribosomal protein L21